MDAAELVYSVCCLTGLQVDLPGKQMVKEVVAGSDGTFLVCASGRLLACGSNEFNKLGFNSETSGLRKRKEKVRSCSLFLTHFF